MNWKPYDPTWLVKLAKEQCPEEPWLPDALARCTSYYEESCAYYRFVGPLEWCFERNILLYHPHEGDLVLDILTGNRVGGIEFLKHVFLKHV